jgi:hypothetical protein
VKSAILNDACTISFMLMIIQFYLSLVSTLNDLHFLKHLGTSFNTSSVQNDKLPTPRIILNCVFIEKINIFYFIIIPFKAFNPLEILLKIFPIKKCAKQTPSPT